MLIKAINFLFGLFFLLSCTSVESYKIPVFAWTGGQAAQAAQAKQQIQNLLINFRTGKRKRFIKNIREIY